MCHPFPSPESGNGDYTKNNKKPGKIQIHLAASSTGISNRLVLGWVFRKKKLPRKQLGRQQKERTMAHLADNKGHGHGIPNY